MPVTVHVYAYRGRFFIPTVAKTEAGFLQEIDPVGIVGQGHVDVLTQAVESALARGNPTVPTPSRHQYPVPAIVRAAGVRSWTVFEKNAHLWRVESTGDGCVLITTKRAPDRGFQDKDSEYIPREHLVSVGRRILELSRVEDTQ